jgi:hypothetical protein
MALLIDPAGLAKGGALSCGLQCATLPVCAWIIADLEQGVRPWMKPWNAEDHSSYYD